MRLARRMLRSELTRLEQVDLSLAGRLTRVETEVHAVQQAQGRRLESLEAEVRLVQERLRAIEAGADEARA